MAATIRQATASDAPQWIDLLRSVLGDHYPFPEVYDPAWVSSQLDASSGQETWIVELDERLLASASCLPPAVQNVNPITNLGRILFRPGSYADGAAGALVGALNELAIQRGHLVVARVLASDNSQQALLENSGFACVGFQPFKHLLQIREGVLFYVRMCQPMLVTRLPLSESLPQINELAVHVLDCLQIANPLTVRDGATGYPLQTEMMIHDASAEDFDLWRLQGQSANPTREVSTGYNLGWGLMRIATEAPIRAILGQREDQIVAGLAYAYDEQDRCLRIMDSFAADDLSTGAMVHHLVDMAQDRLKALTVEVDVLATAPRLLKSAEQLGFVPVAYLPAFFFEQGCCADVVKLVKLNLPYSLENTALTAHANRIVEIVDHNFQDQKVGIAVVNLLRSLSIFQGLGDGELRKIARIFTQKLVRQGERVFHKGEAGQEAYVVMRGQVDIWLEDQGRPVASMQTGHIFGEQAFLESTTRVASAIASQPTILLVVQRSAFNRLVQSEPHLGMVVMKNVAMELSAKLRHANTALISARQRT
jgi:hypothetical protein